jgi:hypothetical protein
MLPEKTQLAWSKKSEVIPIIIFFIIKIVIIFFRAEYREFLLVLEGLEALDQALLLTFIALVIFDAVVILFLIGLLGPNLSMFPSSD